jgi:RimJ/RimL family protein N-acetyltransferase
MSGVRLELLTAAHVDDMLALAADPDIVRYTRVPDPMPDGWIESWIDTYEQARRDGTREAFAVTGERGEFLGLAMAVHIDRPGRTVELGYVVAPAARGAGVASRALRLLTDWAFAELDALRIELRIADSNEASKSVARRASYRYEGTLRSLHLKQDVRDDTEIWSRLPDDPVS